MRTRTTTLLTLAAAATFALAGCSTTPATSSDSSPAASQKATSATQSSGITVSDSWVKASEAGMTGAFGVITNSGPNDVTLISVSSAASGMSELHETLMNDAGEMVMSQKEDGFTIAAGKSLLLEPGANHIMLMDLTGPITAGAEVSFTLTFSDDSTLEFTAPAKDYSGANENYEGSTEHDMSTESGH